VYVVGLTSSRGIPFVQEATPAPFVVAEQLTPLGVAVKVTLCPAMAAPVTLEVSVAVIVMLRPVRRPSFRVVVLATTVVGALVTVSVPGTNVVNE
jgi:hypothetical protein